MNELGDNDTSHINNYRNETQSTIQIGQNGNNSPTSDYGTARGFPQNQTNQDNNKFLNNISMEQASVNDHYGFYQTPAKIITQNKNDN